MADDIQGFDLMIYTLSCDDMQSFGIDDIHALRDSDFVADTPPSPVLRSKSHRRCACNHARGVYGIHARRGMESTARLHNARTRPRTLSAINHALNLHTKNTQSVDCVFCFITLLLIVRPQIIVCAVVVILGGISVISAVIIWGVIIVVATAVIIANI